MSTFSTTTASLSDAARVAAECRDLMQSLVLPSRRRLGSAKAAHAAVARTLA